MFNLLTYSLDFPKFNTIDELSFLTGLSTNILYSLSKKNELYYHEFQIPKRDGSYRTIHAPKFKLYVIQQWILKNILNKLSPSKAAMAFRSGNDYGCKANAMHHLDTDYTISIDLENFFDSISSKRVYTIFKSIGYDKLPATILTNLCTYKNYLPQGSPCSPALSNLVCLKLDARLSGLCKKRSIHFTRYADDMYFSCNRKDTLKKTLPIIKKIIVNEGFTINERKTRYVTPSNKKEITGITVLQNSDTNISPKDRLKAPKKIKRKIRAEIFNSIYTGNYSNRNHIIGEISYVNYIEPGYRNKIKNYISSKVRRIEIFPELVDAYNSNIFFKDMPNINFNDIFENWGSISEDDFEYFEYLKNSRIEYLSSKNLIDICTYEKWPPSHVITDTSDIFPF